MRSHLILLFVVPALIGILAAPTVKENLKHDVQENYLYSDKTRVVRVPLNDELKSMSSDDLRHRAKELFLENQEIRSERAYISDTPKMAMSFSHQAHGGVEDIVVGDEGGRQENSASTSSSAENIGESSTELRKNSDDADSALDDAIDDLEAGQNTATSDGKQGFEGESSQPQPSFSTSPTDDEEQDDFDPEEGDEDETEQNGGCEGPLCDDKFLDGPENDDLFDVPEEDVVNSGFPNIQSHAQGKDKPCKGLDSSKCVVLLQNGIIFGPYKIPDLVKRLAESAKKVILDINGKKIRGTLYGPLKAKRKPSIIEAAAMKSPSNKNFVQERIDLADVKKAFGRTQAMTLFNIYCKPLNLC